jgi:glucose-6-phosphate 1-dehydrogenase
MGTPLTIVIFGASGDLTARKLIPALYRLDVLGLLPDETQIVGVSRSEYPNTEAFFSDRKFPGNQSRYDLIRKSVGAAWLQGPWVQFVKRFHYLASDSMTAEGTQKLNNWLKNRENNGNGNRLYYLSVDPKFFPKMIANLAEAGMNTETPESYRRVIVEKPFGTNRQTAKELSQAVRAAFAEKQVYRIDHYLGKDTVQNIAVLRFANTLFEPLWNHKYIDHVQITVGETVDVGNRKSFYQGTGVLRDMFQSHILQVMALLAMEYPTRMEAERIRNEKVKVLESIPVPTVEEARKMCVVGQYKGYLESDPVDPNDKTPTYAAIKFHVDNWRWQGVPFFLRSGKALKSRYSEVVIQFQKPPHLMFPLAKGKEIASNRVTIVLQPNESIKLNFETKVPSVDGITLDSQDLVFNYSQAYPGVQLPEAYERLILDAVKGDATLFMREDEIDRAWQIMDPIIEAMESPGSPQPEEYAKGSEGPKGADALLGAGRKWQPIL